MRELLSEVQASVFLEYERATKKFGNVNNGNHESFAVILEETEEAFEQAEIFKSMLEDFWSEIKSNKPNAGSRLFVMRDVAEQTAAEWIQVAAMCYKAEKTAEKGREK